MSLQTNQLLKPAILFTRSIGNSLSISLFGVEAKSGEKLYLSSIKELKIQQVMFCSVFPELSKIRENYNSWNRKEIVFGSPEQKTRRIVMLVYA